MKLIAAVEGGGSTFDVAICNAKNGTIVNRLSIPSTGDPATTLTRCALFLKPKKISALAIACFGPIGLKPDDLDTYGRILSTSPKKSWRGIDILTPLLEACDNCPYIIDTDVNAPAALEFAMSENISSCAYVTVGTGVGVGLVVNGKTVKGLMHPEGGHVPVQALPGDTFGGYSWSKDASLPFFGKNTVESLGCSVALVERYQQLLHQMGNHPTTKETVLKLDQLKDVPDDSEIWDHAANALANLAVSMILMLSMEKIVFGGGVMQRPRLLGDIRARARVLLNGYVDVGDLDNIIVVSKHGNDAGLQGAIHLARKALEGDKPDATEVLLKQEAFQTGVYFGMAIGAVATGLFVRFLSPGNRRYR